MDWVVFFCGVLDSKLKMIFNIARIEIENEFQFLKPTEVTS